MDSILGLDSTLEPTHSIDFETHIYVIEFSPFEWSHNLICVARNTKITVGAVKFQEENPDQEDEVEFHLVRDFHNEKQISAIAWSPESSLSILPRVVRFAAACADFSIRVIYSDVADTDTVEVLTGHVSYVNMLAYDPNSKILASGSDDCTVRLWKDTTCLGTLVVDSPVVSVCWHHDEPNKLLVAELSGLILLFNSVTQQALLTLSTDEFPLSQMHWAPSRSHTVAAVVSNHIILWDFDKPSDKDMRPLYGDDAVCVRISPTNHQVIAMIGEPKHELKVINAQSNSTLLSTSCKVYGGMTWHSKLPYICVSIDRKLCLWKVNMA